jgi:hypothetical protein
MQDAARAAELAAARKLTRRAEGQIRKASRSMAEAEDGFDVHGQYRVRAGDDLADVNDLILLALSEHPEADVVVLIPNHHGPRSGA